MNKEIKTEAIFSLLIKILEFGLLFVISLLLGNALSKHDYGQFVLFERLVLLLVNFMVFGSDFHLIRVFSRSYKMTKSDAIILSDYLVFSGIILLITFLIGVVLNGLYFDREWFYLFLIGLSALPMGVTFLQSSLFIGKKAVVHGTLFRIALHRLIFSLGIIFCYLLFDFSLKLVLLVFIISRILSVSISSISLKSYLGENFIFSIKKISFYKQLALDSIPHFVYQILFQLTQQFIIFYLGILNLYGDLATFDIGLKFALICSLPQLVISRSLSVRVGNLNQNDKIEELRQLVWDTSSQIQIISAAIVVLITILSPFVIKLFLPKYVGAELVIYLLVFAQWVKSNFGGVEEVLRFSGSEKLLAKISSQQLLFLIGTTFILSRYFGFTGVLMAVVSTEVLFISYKYLICRRLYGIQVPIPFLNWNVIKRFR